MEDIYLKATQILDFLRDIELVVAELYQRFAIFFPTDRVFWEDLSADEANHAALVAELKNTLLKNGSPFEIRKVNLPALGACRQGVQGQLNRLERGELGRKSALFVARDFEKMIIENRFYDAIQSEHPEYLVIKDKIRKETEFHLQKLDNYIKTLFPLW
ncbi:MAG: hypothetical protein AB1715_03285 [Acidobacteriota bacterium]